MAELVNSLLEDMPKEEDMRKLIECPVCMEIPLPPIYLCTKGHIVCNSCQHRTYSCPLCKERYCSTRSFVAEGIVENLVLRCRFAEEGCPMTMKGFEVQAHTLNCDYRPVKCHECGGKLLNYNEYQEHLFSCHKIIGVEESETCVAYRMNLNRTRNFADRCMWPQYYMKAFDKFFLFRLSASNAFICAWICLLGPKAECENYVAYIEFQAAPDDITISWTGPVNHFRDDPLRNIFLQARGLAIPIETIMEIGAVSVERAEWVYRVAIIEKPDLHESPSTPPEELVADTTTAIPISRGITTGESTNRDELTTAGELHTSGRELTTAGNITSQSGKETESAGDHATAENNDNNIQPQTSNIRLYPSLSGRGETPLTQMFEARIPTSVLDSCRTAISEDDYYSEDL